MKRKKENDKSCSVRIEKAIENAHSISVKAEYSLRRWHMGSDLPDSSKGTAHESGYAAGSLHEWACVGGAG